LILSYQRSLVKNDIVYPSDSTKTDNHGITFMIAGLAMPASNLAPIAEAYANKTEETTIILDHASHRQTLIQSAKILCQKIRHHRNNHSHGQMSLIGFSRGGKVAQLIAHNQFINPFVSHLITIGTSHLGSQMANHYVENPQRLLYMLARWDKGPSLIELMVKNTAGKKSLNSDAFNQKGLRSLENINIGLIAGCVSNPDEYRDDNTHFSPNHNIFGGHHDGVVSVESALGLDNTKEQKKIIIPRVNHHDLEISKAVLHQLITFKNNGHFDHDLLTEENSQGLLHRTIGRETMHPIGYRQIEKLLSFFMQYKRRSQDTPHPSP
jgi:hypothetical protein